jgi:hypothetical protein
VNKYIIFILIVTVSNLFSETPILENEEVQHIVSTSTTENTNQKHDLLVDQANHINQKQEDIYSKEHFLINAAATAGTCAVVGLAMEYIAANNKDIHLSKKLAIYGLTCIGIASVVAIRDIHASHDLKEQQKLLAEALGKVSGPTRTPIAH